MIGITALMICLMCAAVIVLTSRSRITVYSDRIVGQVNNPEDRVVMQKIDIPLSDIKNVDVAGKSSILYTTYSKYPCLVDNAVELKNVIMQQAKTAI